MPTTPTHARALPSVLMPFIPVSRWLGLSRRPAPQRSLPPLPPEKVSAVFDDAERAAAHHWITGAAGVNPHASGSRAFVLWITHYYATLLEMTLQERPARELCWDEAWEQEPAEDRPDQKWLPAGAAFDSSPRAAACGS